MIKYRCDKVKPILAIRIFHCFTIFIVDFKPTARLRYFPFLFLFANHDCQLQENYVCWRMKLYCYLNYVSISSMSRKFSEGVAIRVQAGWPKNQNSISGRSKHFFCFAKFFVPDMGCTKSSFNGCHGLFSWRKAAEAISFNSAPSSAKVTYEWSYSTTSP
jgi:hypothetical protein